MFLRQCHDQDPSTHWERDRKEGKCQQIHDDTVDNAVDDIHPPLCDDDAATFAVKVKSFRLAFEGGHASERTTEVSDERPQDTRIFTDTRGAHSLHRFIRRFGL